MGVAEHGSFLTVAGKTVLEPAVSQFSTWFLTAEESFAHTPRPTTTTPQPPATVVQFCWEVDPKPSDSKWFSTLVTH